MAATFCAALAGCSTPQEVRDLASQGVALTGTAESELDAFIDRSNRLYAQRYASVKRLALGDIDANAKTDFENYTGHQAGMADEAGMIELIKGLSDYRAKTREDAEKKNADIEKSQGGPGEAVKAPKDKLAELKKAFAALSEELSKKEWLSFAVDFGKQIGKSVKESKTQADQKEQKAKDRADQKAAPPRKASRRTECGYRGIWRRKAD